MTANSNNQTLDTWLGQASKQLARNGSTSPGLDSELIACHELKKSRTWLHAHGEYEISDVEQKHLNVLVERRSQHEPLAYIIGSKDFYGREFAVSPAVLVPRPESEDFIELIRAISVKNAHFVDVGAGSGILAITTALEQPSWSGTATDISPDALKVTQKNAKNLGIQNLVFKEQNLLANDSAHYDIVLANLPYVPEKLRGKPDLAHEPDLALFADHDGLTLYEKLFEQLAARTQRPSHVLTESLKQQHPRLELMAKRAGYSLVEAKGLIQHFIIH